MVGKVFKLLGSLAMEMIVIWVPFEKQVVGEWRPLRKFLQLLIPFFIEMVVNWLSLEKQVVGQWRQGESESEAAMRMPKLGRWWGRKGVGREEKREGPSVLKTVTS